MSMIWPDIGLVARAAQPDRVMNVYTVANCRVSR